MGAVKIIPWVFTFEQSFSIKYKVSWNYPIWTQMKEFKGKMTMWKRWGSKSNQRCSIKYDFYLNACFGVNI
jgi:hypothetical protein